MPFNLKESSCLEKLNSKGIILKSIGFQKLGQYSRYFVLEILLNLKWQPESLFLTP